MIFSNHDQLMTKYKIIFQGSKKLEIAINKLNIAIKNKICLDIGTSTGGFAYTLIKHGAKKIYTVDIGYGQLYWKLRINKKIINLERTHILHITNKILNIKPSIITVDLSFISLLKIIPKIITLSQNQAHIFILIKPQFEIISHYINHDGIIKNKNIRKHILHDIIQYAKHLKLQYICFYKYKNIKNKKNIEYISVFKKTCQKLY